MTTTETPRTVHRIEVRPLPAVGDPAADELVREARSIGYQVAEARTAKVYLLETDATEADLERALTTLFADPVTEEPCIGALPGAPETSYVEVVPKPGVMDPVAASVREALRNLYGIESDVITTRRYELDGVRNDESLAIARRLLASDVIHTIHGEPFHPEVLPHGTPEAFRIVRMPLTELSDEELEARSREAHLFLSLDEMRAIRAEYRGLGREPTDIELETLAQTWSEHCVHKTLKSTVLYREAEAGGTPIDFSTRPGHEVAGDGAVTIHNLLKSTVAAATHELMAEDPEGIGSWCLSVFEDNAGVIAFDNEHAIAVKVETHNHPSALEPYGGAATGVGGCIRDIIGTGLAAKPIANTDVFCVAQPDGWDVGDRGVPEGCLHPRRILTEIVAGVRDYGNRMGIPTVNGAVSFDDRYVGNPLVYCGCVGVMPRGESDALIKGDARENDRIIAIGGRTGRDGIHGATFSSAELTGGHADEFAHAVQIGNPIEEKRVLDAVLRARDAEGGPLYSAITDCGAGGFSSAIGEMGATLGAEVHLDRAPLKYAGLTYTEIWISEAQERMVLAVPPEKIEALRAICEAERVEMADLGVFGTPGRELVLNYDGSEVGRLPMAFVHEGLPMPTREAVWTPSKQARRTARVEGGENDIRAALLKLLADPDIASKHWIVRQYDHEVQGATAIKPLGGPAERGPMDAAVIEPVPGGGRGLAIGSGLATRVGDPALGGDPYEMALAAIDECVRNLVCVGADPDRIAILDNFCWPSCKKPENLASLVRACEGCYDGAKAYRTPFISGKDSLNNQFTTADGTTIEIPPTLLITGVGIVEDITACVTMDAKRPGGSIVLVASADPADPRANAETARAVAAAISNGLVRAAHDVSDGGVLCAVAEMLIAGSTPEAPIGAEVDPDAMGDPFEERAGRYVLEIDDAMSEAFLARNGDRVSAIRLGRLRASRELAIGGAAIDVNDMAGAWLGTLDW